MNDHEPPSGGRTRTSTRQQSAPAGKGWDPMERCDWAAVAAVLPTPWPLGAQRHDLRYWASRQRAHEGDRPGYRALAERWGVSEKAARVVCADVGWWADPRFGDEDPKRAQQGRSKGAPGAHEGRTKGAPDHVTDDVLNVKGRTKGAPGAHEGRTKGAPGAPKDNSDRDTHNDTDTSEHTSAAPPSAAGAAQLSLLSGQAEEVKAKPARPSKAAREVEAAADLLARLDAMRLQRLPGGRPLKPETWLPEVRRALRRQTAQEVLDGWTWLLRSPDAAWHRGEERGGTDRTRDLKLLVAHPEYAERRTWRGLEGPHEHDIEPREPEAIAAPAVALTPYQIAVAAREERERLENAELLRQFAERIEANGDADDLPF